MAVVKTEFINGISLSYPIGVFTKLFDVLGAKTKRKFFDEIARLDGAGGEGLTTEQLINMFMVGMCTDIPDVTYEQAASHVQDYLSLHGDVELSIKLVDAFVDAGLNDRGSVNKKREAAKKAQELADELEKIQYEKNQAYIKQSWAEVEKLNSKIKQVSAELSQGIETIVANDAVEVDDPLETAA